MNVRRKKNLPWHSLFVSPGTNVFFFFIFSLMEYLLGSILDALMYDGHPAS